MTGDSYRGHIVSAFDSDARLGPNELAVLRVLVDNAGRVVSRLDLARRAGIADRGTRRCDSLLVTVRRALGPESIRTVRARGWMLELAAHDRAVSLLADRQAE